MPFPTINLNLGYRKKGGDIIPTLGTLIYNFDAKIAGSITEAGTGVSVWADQSGNGYDVLQGTDADRPTFTTDGSNPALLFNGTSDFLNASGLAVTNTQQLTMFGVARPTDRLTNYYAWQTNASGGSAITDNEIRGGSFRSAIQPISGGSSRIDVVNSDTLIHAWISRHTDNVTGVSELDDGTTGSDATVGVLQNFFNQIFIGKNGATNLQFMPGYIMQIGAYEERLDDASKTILMDTLKTKWGI